MSTRKEYIGRYYNIKKKAISYIIISRRNLDPILSSECLLHNVIDGKMDCMKGMEEEERTHQLTT